jgi:hypothetical protein
MELQGHAAHRSDALQHRERVPGVFGVLKAGNHGLRGANLPGKFGLSQARILSHLADQERQVNLMQGALAGLAVGCALARALFDDLVVSVALGGSSHDSLLVSSVNGGQRDLSSLRRLHVGHANDYALAERASRASDRVQRHRYILRIKQPVQL